MDRYTHAKCIDASGVFEQYLELGRVYEIYCIFDNEVVLKGVSDKRTLLPWSINIKRFELFGRKEKLKKILNN